MTNARERSPCGRNGGGCEIAQTSEYSKLAGVPVALIGLIGYAAILGSSASGACRAR